MLLSRQQVEGGRIFFKEDPTWSSKSQRPKRAHTVVKSMCEGAGGLSYASILCIPTSLCHIITYELAWDIY